MYTAEDFERHYIRYKAEGFPRGESMEGYCFRHNIPYNLFDKWYRDTRHKIVPVRVQGMPSADNQDCSDECPTREIIPVPNANKATTHVAYFELRFSGGLRIKNRNISFEALKRIVENLEAIC